MSHPRNHVLTGGTGFVGRALILELLTRTDDDVICLVRAAGTVEETSARLHLGLTEAALAYRIDPMISAAIGRRCRVIAADLTGPLDQVAAPLVGKVDQIWHCAASLRYLERDRDTVMETNVGGTERMLDLAGIVGAAGFHYISTAYVVGPVDGRIEELPVREAPSNNVYEESKLRAEEAVLTRAPAGTRVTILRPSVVVGHSYTSAVSGTLSGIYGLAHQLALYAQRGDHPSGQVRICLNPADTIDLVPVDLVASEAISCGLKGADRTVYHLTGGRPVRVGALIESLCQVNRLPAPVFVADPEDLRGPERRLAERLGFYSQYLRGDKQFVRTNTDSLTGAPERQGIDAATLGSLSAWHAAQRSTKSPIVKEVTTMPDRVDEPTPGVTRIVMVGGGYTSLLAYRALHRRSRRAIALGQVHICVVAPGGVHRFHGWTGDVLSGILAPSNQLTSLAEVCPGADVIDGCVTAVDLAGRTVTVAAAEAVTVLPYDHLVLGPGSVDSELVPGLGLNSLSPKKPEDLTDLRQRLRKLVDGSSTTVHPIVVIGGGLAGVETCAAVAELFARSGISAPPRIVLLHSGTELLPELLPRFRRLTRYAQRRLLAHGIEIRTEARVAAVLPESVELADGTTIPAELVINAVGQRPVRIPGTDQLERTDDGRIRTDGRLRVPGADQVWAGGDVAAVPHLVNGQICPPNALWAIKHGSYIGRNLARVLGGREPRRFSYLGLGRAGSLGVGQGILHLYGLQFTGRLAWLMRASLFLRFMPSRRRAIGAARELFGRGE
jgi:NADH dehydrogenase